MSKLSYVRRFGESLLQWKLEDTEFFRISNRRYIWVS